MTKRHPEVLVAPTVTFLAIVVLIGVSRVYDRLPVQAPACGLRARLGIPCPSCGGTRAFDSLSHGRILEAIAFNPAAIIGAAAALVWFVVGIFRFLILTLNWIYLIFFLP